MFGTCDKKKKEVVYFAINRISVQTWEIHLKCPSRGIDTNYQLNTSYQLIESSEHPVINILEKLGIKAKLTNNISSNDLSVEKCGGVILNVYWPEEEDVPYLQVFCNGERIGATSLDPLGDPLEVFCYAVLEILGFEAELDGA